MREMKNVLGAHLPPYLKSLAVALANLYLLTNVLLPLVCCHYHPKFA